MYTKYNLKVGKKLENLTFLNMLLLMHDNIRKLKANDQEQDHNLQSGKVSNMYSVNTLFTVCMALKKISSSRPFRQD